MITVVTGGSGHIGANLIRAMLSEGRRVRAIVHNDTRALDGLGIERVHGDVLDPASLGRAFDGAEVVYHLAAMVTIRSDRTGRVRLVNVEGTRNVIAACRDCGVRRLVYFSSIHAYDPHPLDQEIDESRALASGKDLPVYDASKAEAERAVLEEIDRGLDAVIVNPTAVIGPHDYRPSAMGQVFLDLYRRRLPALVKGGFNWVDARDVCAGAMAAERVGIAGDRYLLAGHWLSLYDLAKLIEETTGICAPSLVIPVWLAKLVVPFAAIIGAFTEAEPKFTRASLRAVTQHQRVSHEKASRALGYSPRPLRESITDTYAWFRERGWLE
jgi:dihydroflavonol-4-reductase